MEEILNHQDFVDRVKQKKIRIIFNPLFPGMWKAPLPQQLWVMQGLMLSFLMLFLLFGFPASLLLGGNWFIYLITVILGLSYLCRIILIRYYINYALKNEKFYTYCINEGTIKIEELKKQKTK
jgi:hypothetical protein